MRFDKNFFEKHQSTLLRLARSKWTRWLFGLNRMSDTAKDVVDDIQKITPASIHTSKLVLKNGQMIREWTSINFTRPRFQEALVYNLHPFVSFFGRDRKTIIWRLSPVGALALLIAPFIPKLGFLGFIGTVTDFAAGSGDGIVGFWGTADNSWATWRDAATGNINNTTNTTGNDGNLGDSPNIGVDGNTRYGGTRLFIPVDTSGIPDTDAVTAASLFLCSDAGATRATWADNNVEITESTVVSNTALANADFDLWGSTKWATGIAHSALAASGTFNEFVLNSTGYGAINKTGFSKYCVRFAYDVDNSAPALGSGRRIVASFRLSEYSGTSSDPYLRVTHATAATIVTPSALTLTSAVLAPTVVITDSVTPSALAITLTLNAPSLKTDDSFAPSALALTLTLQTPTVLGGKIATPSALALTSAVLAPTFSLGRTAPVSAVALTSAVYGVTFVLGQTVSPSPLELALTLKLIAGRWNNRVKPTSTWTNRTRPS